MKSTITHWHNLYFTPRNAQTEEEAERVYNSLRQNQYVTIDRSCTTHIKISWLEKEEIGEE